MIDGRIKFRHLQCFLAVVHHSSLQKAAAALCVSQPAVSKTIKELEDILKVRLFDRSRSGTQLTHQAEIFAAYAEAAVHALQAATNSMTPTLNAVSRPAIKIGATPAMATSFLPQALMTFRKHVPAIQISLSTGPTGYLMEQLREREFDLVLCRHLDPAQMAGLSFEYLFTDPLVAVVRADHPLLDGAHDADPEVHQFTAVLPPKTSINRRAAAPLAVALKLGAITDYIESLSVSFGRIYTLGSDAIWFAPWSSVKLDVEGGAFVRLLPAEKSGDNSVGLMAQSIGLMMRSNSRPTADTQILVTAIRDCAVSRRAEIF